MAQNIEKYDSAFQKVFGNNIPSFVEFKFKVSPQWDSMSQLALISAIEDEFEIEFELDDIFGFNSYDNGKKILKEKFGLEF